MFSRTKTYVALDWDGDITAVEQLYKWNDEEQWRLALADGLDIVHPENKSLSCNKKMSIKRRMDESNAFILIVGDATLGITTGGCHECARFNKAVKRCSKGSPADFQGYLEYECEEAAKAHENDKVDIIILYNSTEVDKTKCPGSLGGLGRHASMRKLKGRESIWDFESVKQALGM